MKKRFLLSLLLFLSFWSAPFVQAETGDYIRFSEGSLEPAIHDQAEALALELKQDHDFEAYAVTVTGDVDLQELADRYHKEWIGQGQGSVLIYHLERDETAASLGNQIAASPKLSADFLKKAFQSKYMADQRLLTYLGAIETVFEHPPLLVDQADLLSDQEENALLAKLEEISARHQNDVVIVTVDGTQGIAPIDFADDFYDYQNYGQGPNADGILLLISMQWRDWHITTTGKSIQSFTDAGLEYMENHFLEDISNGDYVAGFTRFAELSDQFLTQAETGKPYDRGNMPKSPAVYAFLGLLSLVLGGVVAWAVTSFWKNQLISVQPQNHAGQYLQRNHTKLTISKNIFLYRRLFRQAIPRTSNQFRGGSGGSSGRISSSGSFHGGRGGKF